MSGLDSISDPVARRISYTGSCPSARLLSARLNSARFAVDYVAGGSHYADVLADCSLTWHADAMLMSWWRHHYPGLARGSGHLAFGSGQPIRAKKTRVTCGARLCAWPATSPERDGACGRFRRPISTRFLPVASSLPPLHSGMVKTQFWQFSFLSKNQTPL